MHVTFEVVNFSIANSNSRSRARTFLCKECVVDYGWILQNFAGHVICFQFIWKTFISSSSCISLVDSVFFLTSSKMTLETKHTDQFSCSQLKSSHAEKQGISLALQEQCWYSVSSHWAEKSEVTEESKLRWIVEFTFFVSVFVMPVFVLCNICCKRLEQTHWRTLLNFKRNTCLIKLIFFETYCCSVQQLVVYCLQHF